MAIETKVNTSVWCGDKELTLTFPDNWDVSVYESKGAEALGESEVKRAFTEPIGAKRIAELARRKKNAVIIVDDLSRPTPAHLVIPNIIEELQEGGIKGSAIKFVIGGGLHRPLTKEEMAKKVGMDIASSYEVYNHNAFSKTLENMGNLEDGTPVQINELVANSDLKIAIGGIIPHIYAGFGGGGKIVVPGVASYDATVHNHQGQYKPRGRGNIEKQSEEKDMRDNAEDVARLIGLDFMVNMVLTKNRGIAGLFVGDVIESHIQGMKFAKGIYETTSAKAEVEKTDIVVINAYPQDYDPVQISKSMWPSGVFKNAQKIMIHPCPDGIFYHGIIHKVDYDTFLKMKADKSKPTNILEKVSIESREDFILLSANYPKDEFYKQHPNGAMFGEWEELIGQLEPLYNKAKVAVIPYSPIQVPRLID